MSARRQSAIVSRNYRPELDSCSRALELLLKMSVRKEGNPTLAALGNDGKAKGDSADGRILSD
jgi:hypothetical protein